MRSSVLNNPYRIVGLLAGSSVREFDRQIKRLKQFIEADHIISDDFSFPVLGTVIRSLEAVNESASKLNLDKDKLEASLFWFYNGNVVADEPAFDLLKEGNIEGAYSIWKKMVVANGNSDISSTLDVTLKNASAFSNLATLFLSGMLADEIINEAEFNNFDNSEISFFYGMTLKLKFLDSDFYKSFINKVVDETYKISKKDIQLSFLNNIFYYLNTNQIVSKNTFLKIINSTEFEAKTEFIKSLSKKPEEEIEKKIDQTKQDRKGKESNAINFGNDLLISTLANLEFINEIYGKGDFKYSSIADKIANEVLQCSIDYFNFHLEIDKKMLFVGPAVELANKAKNIAQGDHTINRIDENLEIMERMKDRELNNALQVLKSIKNSYETISFGYVMNGDKVVSFVQDEISEVDVFTISISVKQKELKQYRELVEYLIGKMNFSQFLKVKYLCYWLDGDWQTTSVILIKKLPNWAKGILYYLLLLLVVALIWGEEGVSTLWGFTVFIGIMLIIGWLRGR
jgi:hypothetical protein